VPRAHLRRCRVLAGVRKPRPQLGDLRLELRHLPVLPLRYLAQRGGLIALLCQFLLQLLHYLFQGLPPCSRFAHLPLEPLHVAARHLCEVDSQGVAQRSCAVHGNLRMRLGELPFCLGKLLFGCGMLPV
jgi:hypothetical protein